ncbi:hypothetical protein ASD88_01075 [Pelomonas sp. Root662]|nr:hypothetical protein ASC81_01075 [Pelomonas sp. Root405]KRA77505.1 hypothetical protein ASD88_01075 [Pelomonas sp. Root662]
MASGAAAAAASAELVLPCPGYSGQAVPDTIVKAVREDYSGAEIIGRGSNGVCRIVLPPGAFWVKAESSEARSVAIRVVDATAPGRILRMLPLKGAEADLQQSLAAMVRRDQQVRRALEAAQTQADQTRIQEAERALMEADAVHASELKRLLETRGIPTAAEVGIDGVGAVWLLLQHSPDLMAQHMPGLRAAAAAGEIQRSNLALSEDRVDMIQGRPQRYGSQLQPGPDGRLARYRWADPDDVDVRRAEMDLEPLRAYLKRFDP